MPDTACLHIQDRETDPIRVVTLPGLSIRIGRAAYCEVRLPDVAEEECQLRRRGRTWHLVPLGRPGAVQIDDHPVEQSRPLPFGVPFRVGDHRLTLQSTGTPSASTFAPAGWGTFERPIAAESRTGGPAPATTSWRDPVATPSADDPAEPGPAPAPAQDEARREARQEQRANWLRAQAEEKRWEGRWRAAGERLRSHAAAVPLTPGAPPAEPVKPRRPVPPPYAPPPPSPAREPRPASTAAPVAPASLVPAPASRLDRATLAPTEWGRTPVPPRPAPRAVPPTPSRGQIAPLTPLPADLPTRKQPTRSAASNDELRPSFDETAYSPPVTVKGPDTFPIAPGAGTANRMPFDPATSPEEGSSYSLEATSGELDPGITAVVNAPIEEPDAPDASALLGLGSDSQPPTTRRGEEPGALLSLPEEEEKPLPSSIPAIGREEADQEVAPADGSGAVGQAVPENSGATASDDEERPDPAVEHDGPFTESRTTGLTGEEPLPLHEAPTFATWVEAPSPLGYAPGELPGSGRFVADTNLEHAESWTEPETNAETAAPTDQEPAKVDSRLRSAPGRRRRVSARQGSLRAPAATEPAPGSRPVGHDPASTTAPVAPPIEGPAPGANAKTRESLQRLPTAREILAAQKVRPQPTESVERPRAAGRRGDRQPLPTVGQEPDAWRVPLWLGWVPALALALVVGGVGLVLSWSWALEGGRAGHIADRLARGESKPGPLPEWVTPPEPKWWKTTPGHLLLWAFERDRSATPSDPAAVEEVHELLSAALQASPLEPRARFAMARNEPEAGPAATPAASLALSRDVVALGWTAHRLLIAGKKEEALRAYRSALELASKADPARLATPTFLDDAQVRRYALPGEDLIGPIVRDMAAHEGWTYAEWSEALPAYAVAPLVAARVLRERSSLDASAPLDTILAAADVPAPDGVSAAVHLAAQAEAFALKGRWDEAEQRYRRAIDLMPGLPIRRSWWMNLAEIALRLNNESSRQKALEAARGSDIDDEITRRAAEMLKSYYVRGATINTHDITASRLQ